MTFIKFKYYLKLMLGRHPFVFPNRKMNVKRLGSEYGGWDVVIEYLNGESIVYSVGIGTDISFDEALINRLGCNIYAYDPTPKVKEWVGSNKRSDQFIFNAIGLGASDDFIDFYVPENPNNISHSISPSSKNVNAESIKIPVKALSSLMDANNHTHIDLIKMDIEGFEYSVIENIVAENVLVKQLLVEYHHGFYKFSIHDTKKSIQLLLSNGFDLVHISDTGREYTFLNSNME